MLHHITVLPHNQVIQAADGANLLHTLRSVGLAPDAPCGGVGSCGKCRITVNGKDMLACQTVIDQDLVVTLADAQTGKILTDGIASRCNLSPVKSGHLLAFDIGTTTVAGYLLDGKTGLELASQSCSNPQAAFGADVISRIRHALNGQLDLLSRSIRSCVETLALELCQSAHISADRIGVVSLVGNPAMQQLFLGIRPDNLAQIPFAPVLTRACTVDAKDFLPCLENAALLVVPDISGFVGADTIGCILATEINHSDAITLLVDIGTNGEMVLGNRQQMVACSTAAGPALEGANIHFGMRGQIGAIDHVWIENESIRYSVIGGGKARGICGSGLIDAVAVALELGLMNERGRILDESRRIAFTSDIFLTQEDIRQVQLAKGAIAAGIELMAQQLGIGLAQIETVYLAGAFGTFMNPHSACRIGLLPPILDGKITAVGNAAGSGAKILACSGQALEQAQHLAETIRPIELADLPAFAKTFAKCMRF